MHILTDRITRALARGLWLSDQHRQALAAAAVAVAVQASALPTTDRARLDALYWQHLRAAIRGQTHLVARLARRTGWTAYTAAAGLVHNHAIRCGYPLGAAGAVQDAALAAVAVDILTDRETALLTRPWTTITTAPKETPHP